LGIKTTRPYRNICEIDSREVNIYGLIKDIPVSLIVFYDIFLTMDLIIIDALDAWGMILYHKWDTYIGGYIQMDLSYATSPNCENTYVTLHHEQMRKYRVEDPLDPMNESFYYEEDLGYYTILATNIAPQEDVNVSWKMNFGGYNSRIGASVGMVFDSPKGDTLIQVDLGDHPPFPLNQHFKTMFLINHDIHPFDGEWNVMPTSFVTYKHHVIIS
jgi:hypothetical protein